MKLTKVYATKDLNFHHLPDLMQKVESSIPSEALVERDGSELILTQRFHLRTESQIASTSDAQEFRDILRTLDDAPTMVEADVECRHKEKHLSEYTSEPPALSFEYGKHAIRISISRSKADNIKALFLAFEETLSLEAVEPPVQTKERAESQRTVFVAHSFDEKGKSYAYELIKLLTLLDFQVSTGEGYSPEGVSQKVKKRLLAQEVVVVVVSRKQDSTWLTQEAAGATFTEKPLIFLIEEGIEYKPGVLGDLEYIRFPDGQVSVAFVPILEGLQELGYSIHQG